MSEWWHNAFVAIAEWILLIGAVMTAIGIGLKRVYSMARGVEKILEFTVTEKAEREKLAVDLKKHTEDLTAYRVEYNKQIGELVDTVREISRETRPNGGSSMKDVLNATATRVADMQMRVAVLEEWKRHEERAQ